MRSGVKIYTINIVALITAHVTSCSQAEFDGGNAPAKTSTKSKSVEAEQFADGVKLPLPVPSSEPPLPPQAPPTEPEVFVSNGGVTFTAPMPAVKMKSLATLVTSKSDGTPGVMRLTVEVSNLAKSVSVSQIVPVILSKDMKLSAFAADPFVPGTGGTVGTQIVKIDFLFKYHAVSMVAYKGQKLRYVLKDSSNNSQATVDDLYGWVTCLNSCTNAPFDATVYGADGYSGSIGNF